MEKEPIILEEECSDCGGTGEVNTYEPVYPGEPHYADVGVKKCHCKISEPDYDD